MANADPPRLAGLIGLAGFVQCLRDMKVRGAAVQSGHVHHLVLVLVLRQRTQTRRLAQNIQSAQRIVGDHVIAQPGAVCGGRRHEGSLVQPRLTAKAAEQADWRTWLI
jgi:hypothetical protein